MRQSQILTTDGAGALIDGGRSGGSRRVTRWLSGAVGKGAIRPPLFGWVKRTLARPHEVSRVGFLDLVMSRLGESQPPSRTLAPARIYGRGGHEIEFVRVEPQDSQEPREPREVALDDPFQVWHPSAAPILEALRREQVHADQDVDRGNDRSPREDLLYGSRDFWIERVFAIRVDGDRWF